MILKVTFLCDTCKKEWIDVVGVFDYYWEVFEAAHKEGWYIDSENGKAECPSCERTRGAWDRQRAREIAADCGLADHGGPFVVTLPSDIGATWLAPGLGVRGRVIDDRTIELGPNVKP